MLATIILIISMILFVIIHEYFKKEALQGIEKSQNADDACYYRNRFSWQRIIMAIVFCAIAIPIFCAGKNIVANSTVLGLLCAWQAYANKNSLPLSGKRPKDIGNSKFILYLRGFTTDNYSLGEMDLKDSINDPTTFSEAHFINILKRYMPVYAVGMTKELNSPIGAKRIYLNDNEWEAEVIDLMHKATLIVILLNDTQSCIWEICQSNKFKEKVVFISNNNEKLANVRKELNKQHVYPLPIGLKERTLSYTIEGEGTEIHEYSNTKNSYEAIIKDTMFKKFGLGRTAFAQNRLNTILWIYSIIYIIGLIAVISLFNIGYIETIAWSIWIYAILFILILNAYDKLCTSSNRRKNKKGNKTPE